MAKATKKQALGRGLSALLKDPSNDIQSVEDKNADKVVGNIVELELSAIEVNPFQPRTSFNEETLRELASSISSAIANEKDVLDLNQERPQKVRSTNQYDNLFD